MKTISILGGGWLGFALAKEFKNKYKILISSRTSEKLKLYEAENLNAFVLNEINFENIDNLLDTNYLFINFPPSKFDDYLGFLSKIYKNPKIKNIKKIIFISSTSIYPNESGIYTENIEIFNPNSKIVFDAEKLIYKQTDVILRCAGLMGGDRIAGKYFSGKTIDTGDLKVNHVHRFDVIEAVKLVINKNLNGIYNLCANEHPTRKELYDYICEKLKIEKPIYIKNSLLINRIISSKKIEDIGFSYKYNNPKEFY